MLNGTSLYLIRSTEAGHFLVLCNIRRLLLMQLKAVDDKNKMLTRPSLRSQRHICSLLQTIVLP